jgi:hypothetical protein
LTDTAFFLNAFGTAELSDQDYKTWSDQDDRDFKPWAELESPGPLFRQEKVDTPSLDSLASELFPGETVELRSHSRRRAVANKKFLFAEKAVQRGHSQVSIASWFGCTPSGVHRLLFRNKSISQSLTPIF